MSISLKPFESVHLCTSPAAMRLMRASCRRLIGKGPGGGGDGDRVGFIDDA